MPRVIHFDLSADDPERAMAFYKDVFDWQVEKWAGPSDYWLMKTGEQNDEGVTGGIARRIDPADTTAVVFDVPSVDDFAERVCRSGGQIREQKKTLPGVGYLIMCKDTEGNTFGIMEIDGSAE
jgi:predicted enzyme related to lactoylglutathione lyase